MDIAKYIYLNLITDKKEPIILPPISDFFSCVATLFLLGVGNCDVIHGVDNRAK